jgi:tetratricopeptide (TPR) repeat protein
MEDSLLRTKPRTLALAIALTAGTLFLSDALAEKTTEPLNDPLAVMTQKIDAAGRPIVTGFVAYDHAQIRAAIAKLEARAKTDAAHEIDRYVIAQGYAEIATIRRFYEKHAEDDMPASLARLDADEIAEKGLAHAIAFSDAHPDHSDIWRVRAELKASQIRGMVSGFAKGPEALEAIANAQRLDPKNGWALFAQGRMHYHNPAIAGGDKDLSLKELRQVVKSIKNWRVYHYLSLTYDAKDMLPQAWFWAQKARRTAPKNPEVALHLGQVREKREEQ